MSEPRESLHGDVVLGRYRIVRRLATGGMGVLFLARLEGAEGFVRPAVIKRMHQELTGDEELVRLFVREARVLADLRHPGVVSVLDFAAERDAYQMALEYVHGYHLGLWMRFLKQRSRHLDPELALYVVAQVADALHYVHTRTDEHGKPLGIIHRDVSPSNIMVDLEGEVRLLDFGVVRMASEVTAAKAGELNLKGKFAYLAPEMLKSAPPSVRTDLYACGVVLHHLVVGRNEFKDRDPTETLRRVLMHDLSSVEGTRDGIPKGLDEVVRRATHRDPEERYQDAGELAAALRELFSVSEQELKERLRAHAKRDFEGELPQALKVPALAELERSWREPRSVPADLDPEPELTIDVTPSELRDPPPEPIVAEPTPTPYRWAMLGLLVLAISGIGLGAYALFRDDGGNETGAIVVVDRQRFVDPSTEPTQTAAAPNVDESESDHGTDQDGANAGQEEPPEPRGAGRRATPPSTTRQDRPATRGGDRATVLSRQFNRRRAALHRCFTRHASAAEGRPQLSVRFQIDRAGRVQSATLDPAPVAGTPLGACLLGVARSTRFGPQPDAISFRIPIVVHGG